MAYQALSFDNSDVKVVSRDDNLVALELVDRFSGELQGIVKMRPDDAIDIGKLLVIKGDAIKEMEKARESQVTAWRDRDDRIWYGEQGSENMHPAGSDTDQADHSWDEVQRYFGPLTPVNS